MHPAQAPAAIAPILWRGMAQIKARVWITAHTRFVTGVNGAGNPTFGSTFAEYQWEVTPALLNAPRISLERPQYITAESDGMRVTECTIELFSENGQLAATQDGAILRRNDLEQARVNIYADVGGTLIAWFSGRISGMPEERAGVTTIRATGFDWECLRKPVKYENYGVVYQGLVNSSQQAVYADSGFRTTAAHIPVLSSHVCVEHGITYFDGGGRQAPNVTQSGGEGIALLQIDLKNSIDCGIYKITFRDAKNYTVTYPKGQNMAGIITANLGYTYNGNIPVLTGDIGIRPEFWEGEDGTGAAFEFRVSWAASGNPVAIAFSLIEKGLNDSWGQLPTGLAKMDIPAWAAAIRRFESFTVHVDATNKDNSVFENKRDSLPLTVAQLAQRILDHVGCSLCLNINGEVSITLPYLDDVPVYPHSTADTITEPILINASDYLTNYVTVQYAWNGQSYGASNPPMDLRINPQSQIVEKVISLPYFKAGIGRRFAQWAAETFVRRFMGTQVVVSYGVHAGAGLLAQAGDRITIESNTLPRLDGIAEIFKVDKECGTEQGSRITAHLIQSHEGPRALICVVVIGNNSLW